MALMDLPFQPIRGKLYTSVELLEGFDPSTARSAADTLDFKIYRYFVTQKRSFPPEPIVGLMEALADNSIAQAMFRFLHRQPRVAAIMGGHSIRRDDQVYRDVVDIARRLTKAGFVVATGGGPGVMEAAHLGAVTQGYTDRELTTTLKTLEAVPELPETSKVVDDNGAIDYDQVAKMHAWMLPAWQIQQDVTTPGESLAVPTWYYGSEPLTPLATQVAKFFQNSIREDILLMLAAQGIIYANGRAGTIQEVFQDAAQNYYAAEESDVCPMVFYASDDFWSTTLPVEAILKPMFGLGRWAHKYDDTVKVVDTSEDAANFIIEKAVPVEQRKGRMKALGMTALAAKSAE